MRRTGGFRASLVTSCTRRASSELSLGIAFGPADPRLPPLVDPRRPRPPPPLEPDGWPVSPVAGSQLMLKPISRGSSLSDRLSVHTPPYGESCAIPADG